MKPVVDMDQVVIARAQIERFKKKMTGSFTTCLFDAIYHADISNQRRLAKGFPAEVFAVVERTQGLSNALEMVDVSDINWATPTAEEGQS